MSSPLSRAAIALGLKPDATPEDIATAAEKGRDAHTDLLRRYADMERRQGGEWPLHVERAVMLLFDDLEECARGGDEITVKEVRALRSLVQPTVSAEAAGLPAAEVEGEVEDV